MSTIDTEKGLLKLAEHARQLVAHIPHKEYLISRDVDQIDAASRRLAAKYTADAAANVSKGHFLLARHGFDAERAARNLAAIDLSRAPTLEPLEGGSAPNGANLTAYLQHEHCMRLLSAAEEAKKLTAKVHQSASREAMQEDWQRCKADLLAASRGEDVSAYQYAPAASAPLQQGGDTQRELLGGGGGARTRLHGAAAIFASVVQQLDEARRGSAQHGFALVHSLCAAAIDSGGREAAMVECYEALAYVVGERPPSSVPVEAAWAGDGATALQGRPRWLALADGALHFLEAQYRAFVQQCVAQNAAAAEVGGDGVSESAALLRAYVRVLRKSGRLTADAAADPWTLVYFALRCGEWSVALQFAEQSRSVVGDAAHALLAHCAAARDNGGGGDHAFPGDVRDRAAVTGATHASSHQAAALEAMGAGGGAAAEATAAHVADAAQCWMWRRVSRAYMLSCGGVDGGRAGSEEMRKVRRAVAVEWGAKHFDENGRHPALYCTLLIASGQADLAAAYLAAQGRTVTACHLAIALYYYGIIDDPSSSNNTAGGEEVDMARLLRRYVSSFIGGDESGSVDESLVAMSYLRVLRPSAQRHRALADLALQTGALHILSHVAPPDADAVVRTVSRELREQGDYVRAARVLLAHLREPLEALEVVIVALVSYCSRSAFDAHGQRGSVLAEGDLVDLEQLRIECTQAVGSEAGGYGTRAGDLVSLADTLATAATVISCSSEPGASGDAGAGGGGVSSHAAALTAVDRLGLLPTKPSEVRECASYLLTCDERLLAVLPNLLTRVMRSIVEVSKTLTRGSSGQKAALRERARALGIMDFGATGGGGGTNADVHAQLVRMEILMG